jgi:hypothetical protein
MHAKSEDLKNMKVMTVVGTRPEIIRLDLPPLSSRPSLAVISTFPPCHLDRKGEISAGPDLSGTTRFLASLRI